MTNVAISISSDVSRSLSSLLPFLPAKTNLSPFFFPSALFSETREEAREERETMEAEAEARNWKRDIDRGGRELVAARGIQMSIEYEREARAEEHRHSRAFH